MTTQGDFGADVSRAQESTVPCSIARDNAGNQDHLTKKQWEVLVDGMAVLSVHEQIHLSLSDQVTQAQIVAIQIIDYVKSKKHSLWSINQNLDWSGYEQMKEVVVRQLVTAYRTLEATDSLFRQNFKRPNERRIQILNALREFYREIFRAHVSIAEAETRLAKQLRLHAESDDYKFGLEAKLQEFAALISANHIQLSDMENMFDCPESFPNLSDYTPKWFVDRQKKLFPDRKPMTQHNVRDRMKTLQPSWGSLNIKNSQGRWRIEDRRTAWRFEQNLKTNRRNIG